jgi:Glycosyl hydrolases family 35
MIRRGGLRFNRPVIAAALAGLFLFLLLPAARASAQDTPSFGHAVVVVRDGEPRLLLDGKPFFFLGGAFFYERIPRSRWRESMQRMRELGANTLDLYVPWNWHELADGDFDFTGRTSPRRDLREVLRLGKELGFFFIVRPGPVIRNEWRNGGYPAWLLTRPEYGMPLHDVLEGRYPATATLQNAHSDDAAAQWMDNATHLRYAARWLHRALEEFRPVADRVIAVQLDDDQGAYLDNDTFPAPHLHAYLQWLERQARDVVGPLTPAFINTFEMKVPSSSPVWAMGNWYQSEALKIGDHDRAELAFATATLRTQERGPLAYSEFQAGWLAGPEDPQPRPADPTNTSLALGELTGWGVKGVVDFPLLDTLAPFGWEAPFSNALYAWDAAVPLDLKPIAGVTTTRWLATRRAFRTLAFYGPALAEAHRVADVALLYDGRSDAFHAAAVLKADLAECRARGAACDVVDPLAVGDARLRTFRFVVAHDGAPAAFVQHARGLGLRVAASVEATGAPGGPADAALLRGPHGSFLVVENWSDAPLRVDPAKYARDVHAFAPFVVAARDVRVAALDVDLAFLSSRFANGDTLTTSCELAGDGDVPALTGTLPDAAGFTGGPGTRETCAADVTVGGVRARESLSAQDGFTLDPPHRERIPNAYLLAPAPIAFVPGISLGPNARFPEPGAGVRVAPAAVVQRDDVFEDGASEIVLGNGAVTAIVAPDGGGRVVAFGRGQVHGTIANLFDATGGLRDDVLVQPPPSKTDRIARYTHSYPAGMFNRRYDACTFGDARASGAYLAYDAPDVVPDGARFERVVALAANARRLVVDERFTPRGAAPDQRLVSLSALTRVNDRDASIDDGTQTFHPASAPAALDPSHGGVGFLTRFPGSPAVAVVRVSWRPGDVEAAGWTPARSNGTLRLVLAPGDWRRLTFAFSTFASSDAAAAFVEAERTWVSANRAPSGSRDGEVAKRYTQSPQKRPSESSCGFESHLPHD